MNLIVFFNQEARAFGYVDFANYNNLTGVVFNEGSLVATYAKDGETAIIQLEFIESFRITRHTQH